MKQKKQMILTNYYITKDLHSKLTAYAEELEVSAAHVVREAIKKLLKNEGRI